METFLKVIGAGVVVTVVVVALAALFTWWAWNVFMVEVLDFQRINLVQAFALNLLLGAIGKSASHKKEE